VFLRRRPLDGVCSSRAVSAGRQHDLRSRVSSTKAVVRASNFVAPFSLLAEIFAIAYRSRGSRVASRRRDGDGDVLNGRIGSLKAHLRYA
jgi:hypothetical protein